MQYPKLVESKTSANEAIAIEWNPAMDLLATVFSNGALTCSRLLSLQKVWHKQPTGKIVSISWRPDGRILAIGAYNDKTKENVCTLHDVENGKEINLIKKDKPITSVAWFQYTPPDEEKDVDDSGKPKKSILLTNNSKENFSHQLAHDQTHLNILVISTEDGKISFYALGLFYLGDLPLYSGDTHSKIVKTHMSSCLRYITTVISTKNTNSTSSSLKVIKLNIFKKRSNELLRVAKMYAKITDELEYLDDTINAITTSWADVLAGLDNKLSSYSSRKNKRVDEDRSGYTFLSADELLQLLVIGFPSDNLEKFLTDMSDKGLKKLNNAIEQTCLRVQNLIVKNAQKCCYHLHSDLNLLRGMSLWKERFDEVGLEHKFIVPAMKQVGTLLLKLTELQQVIDHSLKSTKSFFRWLISIACRLTGEQNNSVIPSDINKTTQQDIQLITDFILENFDYNTNQNDLDFSSSLTRSASGVGTGGDWSNRPTCSNFTLEQVGQYFKHGTLSKYKSSFSRSNSNLWIEFLRNSENIGRSKSHDEDEDSAILFYPHNECTTLVEQHNITCKSIATAFNSMAENIEEVMICSETVINMKDFIQRSAPTSRIRVETDVGSMQHHTLFRTKLDPVQRQYLISQSLLDKTFKLISIEFKGHRSPSEASTSKSTNKGGILITDAGFYENKDNRKLLLSFLLLDTSVANKVDTIIVQVELAKLLNESKCLTRNVKDASKCFRTNDSIDKNSSLLVLKLDLYTEPAYKRNHDYNMMVKKIKNTCGRDMFSSSGRGVLAFTSAANKRLHLYELESTSGSQEVMDDEVVGDDKIDESLIDTEI